MAALGVPVFQLATRPTEDPKEEIISEIRNWIKTAGISSGLNAASRYKLASDIKACYRQCKHGFGEIHVQEAINKTTIVHVEGFT